MTDQFDAYKKLLALAQANPTNKALRAAMAAAKISFDNDTPISGYFRCAEFKDGPLEPLAIFRDESGELNVWWGESKLRGDEVRINKFWPYAAWKPVSYEWYVGKLGGKEWPDVHSLVADEPLDGIEEIAGRLDDDPPAAGHNSGATVDEITLLRDEAHELLRGVRDYKPITSDDHRAKSQDLRSKLNEKAGAADKKREALKRPHMEAIRDIDGLWMPLVKLLKGGADTLKGEQEAWGTVQMRRRQEEERQREAARQRLEQEAADRAVAAQAAVDAGQPLPDPVPQTKLEEPARVAPQTSFKGGTGRAAHEKTVTVITEVTDWAKLYLYFVNDQVVRDYILKRAQMFLKNTGEIPPGCVTDVAAKVA